MIHARRKVKIKIIRESYIFTSAFKKPEKIPTINSIDLHIEILLEEVILTDLSQPYSEIAISHSFQYYEELSLTRN